MKKRKTSRHFFRAIKSVTCARTLLHIFAFSHPQTRALTPLESLVLQAERVRAPCARGWETTKRRPPMMSLSNLMRAGRETSPEKPAPFECYTPAEVGEGPRQSNVASNKEEANLHPHEGGEFSSFTVKHTQNFTRWCLQDHQVLTQIVF